MKVHIKPRPAPYFMGLWHSKLSECKENGHIVNYIRSLSSEIKFGIPWSDGYNYENEQSNNKHEFEGYDQDMTLGVLCTRVQTLDHPLKNTKLVMLPLDDNTFQFGLRRVLEAHAPNLDTPWSERRPIVYFRGAKSPLRQKVVEHLFDDKNADVRFSLTPDLDINTDNEKYFDKTFNGRWQPIEITEFIKNKYILIIDGRLISSSYQWVFGSGSVPILVCHPMNNFWFKRFLIPFINYVPVTYPDVGKLNISETVQYLIDHDDIAEQIAKNALRLSQIIFSSEFQKQYVKDQLNALS